MQQKIYFVGSVEEIAHHAAPLAALFEYQIVEPDEVLTTARAGDLAIFFSEHFDRFRNAICELKTKNVATLYMIDGILEWRNAWENRVDEPACPFTMRPILCHKVACIGNAQARVLSSWGNHDKIEVVGIPRFDSLTAERPSNNDRNLRLLVMTAKFPSYTDDQRRKLVRGLSDLKAILDQKQGIDVVWRLTAGLDVELNVENRLKDLSGGDLADNLAQVDAVISTPSTAILESIVMGRPTAVLDYTNSPSFLPVAWNITSVDQIESQVASLLDPPETKIAFQSCSVADALQLAEPATNRLKDLIESMLKAARESVSGQKALRFESSILEPPKCGTSTFDHAGIFSSFDEFQTGDTVELQAQLAHARREILHLQKQLRQIESELGQAHQIFDEINNHPIAGPVVKIRKRILSLINQLKRSNVQPEPN